MVTAAAVQAAQGCVLPVVDAPPPPVVSEAVPPPPPAIAAAPASLAASTSLLPFFIGLGGIAALVLLLDRDHQTALAAPPHAIALAPALQRLYGPVTLRHEDER